MDIHELVYNVQRDLKRVIIKTVKQHTKTDNGKTKEKAKYYCDSYIDSQMFVSLEAIRYVASNEFIVLQKRRSLF